MSESPLHRDLVASLLSHLSSFGEAKFVAGRNEYADPPTIARHEPDVYIVTDEGLEILGEAKTGPDLEDERSSEQLGDFSTRRGPNGERAVFCLAVPVGWGAVALESIRNAGGELHYRVDVQEVGGLDADGPPAKVLE